MRLVNLHVRDTDNVGDLWSAPLRYLRFGDHTHERADWRAVPDCADAAAILGGGALLSRGNPPCKLSVGWGVGHTRRFHLAPYRRVPDAGGFDLLGCRDHGAERWVPCASCLHPHFDRARLREPAHEAVFFAAEDAYRERPYLPRLNDPALPRMTNTHDSLTAVLDHLAGGAVVVTDSYHGVYWGLLLGRGVVCLPTGSKFYHFPPDAEIEYRHAGEWRSGIANARPLPGFIERCRAANYGFAADVADRLGCDWSERRRPV